MSTTTLKRQFITDASGQPIGVILSLQEYALVERILDEHNGDTLTDEDKLHQMELAAKDPLFLADLNETMTAFEAADAIALCY